MIRLPFIKKKRRVRFELILIGEDQYKAHFIDADTHETIQTDLGWLVVSSSSIYPGSTFVLTTGAFETSLPPYTPDGDPIL